MTVTIYSPVSQLSGVGPKLAEKLAKLGITQIVDMLFHLPLRYEDRTRITPIEQLTPHQYAVIEAEILSSQVLFGARRSLMVTLNDGTSAMRIRLFHFAQQQQKAFRSGQRIRCFGDVRFGSQGLEMVHPEYTINPDPLSPLPDRLTPVYPTTEGVSQNQWRKLMTQALHLLQRDRSDLALFNLPEELQRLNLHLADALLHLHAPAPDADLEALHNGTDPAQQRLAFEELLAHQLSMLKLREKNREHSAPVLRGTNPLAQQLLDQLPFTLTNAQQRSLQQIYQDVEQGKPMLRLVQGDVGSGKTIVAALAACAAIDSGLQVALMAPTEILAEQHYHSFAEWFDDSSVNFDLLMGRHGQKHRTSVGERLRSGELNMLIGTHAVFQQDVEFARLGLVIIDEQHRFGVHQRLALRDKAAASGQVPHQLIMTATPIPRTLAMTAYADLDLSVIDELPPGRKPVNTLVLEQHRRHEVMQRLASACQGGQQAYWVCTLIEESESLNCQAAEKSAEALQQELSDVRVGLVHGRLKANEKANVMASFAAGDIDLLVATTVIEVGVNVPNASIMVIENPERLGLAQLHQLRGRVGRGSHQSHCLLMYQSPLTDTAKKRLQVMRETNDGFKIAETDLKIRGPGEVLGTRQTGALMFRVADMERDRDLLPAVGRYAHALMDTHHGNIDTIVQRWIHQADYFAQG
ncbi:ATP-dependent DNA helicase RecG [BD1-7 clade bacterium]|uniref:ATP-dependent DNA helicase RecG n=1 Tax=BD1-7 clade bacterium TaxID=2029982 RepID=A0A5S9QEP0_9GAMM|nr:ATP-dependent DNA helicase RecG [BD1-7 clade bacterium]